MNYHSHQCRDEVWTVVSGEGRTLLDGVEQLVNVGDVIQSPVGCRHTVIADIELHIIEVQMGKELSVEDKQKHKLNAFHER